MHYFYTFCLILLMCSCQKKVQPETQYFRGTNSDKEALLTLKLENKRFHGSFEIRYNSRVKDSGAVRGEIVGDTLKGKFDYRSYGGSKVWAPFMALKENEGYRLGTGVKTTLMNIPLYLPESISFGKENLFLEPIPNPNTNPINQDFKD